MLKTICRSVVSVDCWKLRKLTVCSFRHDSQEDVLNGHCRDIARHAIEAWETMQTSGHSKLCPPDWRRWLVRGDQRNQNQSQSMETNRSADTAQKPVRVHSVQRMKREEIKVCEVKHLEDSADLLRTTLEIRLNSHLTAKTFNRLYGLGRARSPDQPLQTIQRERDQETSTLRPFHFCPYNLMNRSLCFWWKSFSGSSTWQCCSSFTCLNILENS